MSEKRTFFKSAGVYFFGDALSKVIIFFMLPLYTTYISPDDYGYYDLTVTYVYFLGSILFLNIWCGTLRYMYDERDWSDKLKPVYSSLPIFSACLIFYLAAFLLLNHFLHVDYFPLVVVYGVFLALQAQYGSVARGFGKSVRYAVSGIAATAVTVLLNVLLIAVFKQPYWSLYAASSAGILVQIVILEYSLRLIGSFSFSHLDGKLTRRLLVFSFPMCLNAAAFWFLTSFNRVVIVSILGQMQNGYFAIAAKFSVAINLVGACFTLAWQEAAFKKEGAEGGSGDYYSRATDLYIRFLVMGTACVIPAVGAVFHLLVGSAYDAAKALIPLSLMGAAVILLSSFLGNIFSAFKRNSANFLSTLAASFVNIGLLYLLIGRLGVQAANLSLLAGFAVNCAIRIVLLRRETDYHISLRPFLLYLPLLGGVTWAFLTGGAALNVAVLLVACVIALFSFRSFLQTLLPAFSGFRQHLPLRLKIRQIKKPAGRV